MKKLLSLIFSAFCAFPILSTAQNAVPDSSFENMHRIPSKENNGITCTKNWLCPNGDGAGDYYNRAAKRHAGVPHNIFGRQQPHSGDGYGGMCIRTTFIEYVETKLTDTLLKDRDYQITFYVSKANRSIGTVKSFGVMFTKKVQFGHAGIGIPMEPSIEFKKPHGYRNKHKWMKCSGVYHADGTEAAMMLGYFNYNKKEHFKGFTQYYVDDVTVTLLPKKIDSVLVRDSVVAVKTIAIVPQVFAPKLGETITLKNIFFDTGKSELLETSFPELNKLLQFLNNNPATAIEISGHTDASGNESQNKLLSEDRAKAVADYLSMKGIDPQRINYIGYGSAQPVASNTTEEGKQQNRRVEVLIRKK